MLYKQTICQTCLREFCGNRNRRCPYCFPDDVALEAEALEFLKEQRLSGVFSERTLRLLEQNAKLSARLKSRIDALLQKWRQERAQ